MDDALVGWLAQLDEHALAALLERRSDALEPPRPRSLGELAELLGGAASVIRAVQVAPAPVLQLTQALVALGPRTTLEALRELLGGSGGVADWLAECTRLGLAWRAPDGGIERVAVLDEIFGSPFGLGPPVRAVVANESVADLRRVLTALGRTPPSPRRADVVTAVVDALTNAALVRAFAALAPPAIRADLVDWARGQAEFDTDSYRLRLGTGQWAAAHGLAFGDPWGSGYVLPGEVERALLGSDFVISFTPDPPHPSTIAYADTAVAEYAGAAATRFTQLALATLDRLARTPLPALKSGGIGTRELSKAAKALDTTDAELRLVLELAHGAGLLTVGAGAIVPSPDAAHWRAAASADQLRELLLVWWSYPGTPTEARDADGKVVPALKSRPCGGCRAARHALLAALDAIPAGRVAPHAEIVAAAVWARPLIHADLEDPEPFADHLAEAVALGVVAADALSPAGRALAHGRLDELATVLDTVLPRPSDTALFGADLTAVVSGPPAPAVSEVLDAAADRESRGGATVWRFSPGSVRRALDEGRTVEIIGADLAAIATGPLPQPLRYLIADVGRRHGSITVAPAASVLVAADEALLAQAAADRALTKLGLTLLTPTTLAATADQATVLATLRGAGYLPMPADGVAPPPPAAAATEAAETAPRWRRETTERVEHAGGHAAVAVTLARDLRRAGTAKPAASHIERQLGDANRKLSPVEIRQLAHALETGARVLIAYRTESGAVTERVVRDAQLFGDAFSAWCELRDDERWFRLDRVQAVVPVSGDFDPAGSIER